MQPHFPTPPFSPPDVQHPPPLHISRPLAPPPPAPPCWALLPRLEPQFGTPFGTPFGTRALLANARPAIRRPARPLPPPAASHPLRPSACASPDRMSPALWRCAWRTGAAANNRPAGAAAAAARPWWPALLIVLMYGTDLLTIHGMATMAILLIRVMTPRRLAPPRRARAARAHLCCGAPRRPPCRRRAPRAHPRACFGPCALAAPTTPRRLPCRRRVNDLGIDP
ncbi:MAG: hypothetical protein J3K34DRAFT_404012 [Monoraphidium minutum]|nr:MAG: hypothetical protein J3K34DRAFT_404012 [Monoraphidium minutum]